MRSDSSSSSRKDFERIGMWPEPDPDRRAEGFPRTNLQEFIARAKDTRKTQPGAHRRRFGIVNDLHVG
jgi:hypothetical protein